MITSLTTSENHNRKRPWAQQTRKMATASALMLSVKMHCSSLLSLWSTTFASAISPVNITKGNIKGKEKLGKLT